MAPFGENPMSASRMLAAASRAAPKIGSGLEGGVQGSSGIVVTHTPRLVHASMSILSDPLNVAATIRKEGQWERNASSITTSLPDNMIACARVKYRGISSRQFSRTLPRVTSEVLLSRSITSSGVEWVTTIRDIFMTETC